MESNESAFLGDDYDYVDDLGTPLLDKTAIKATLFLCYVVVLVCCVLGNMLVLYVIGRHKSMRTATNFFLANLAAADMLVGVFCVAQNMVHMSVLSHASWPFGALLCRVYVFTLHFVPCASAGILVLLSVERYVAVLKPMLVGELLTAGRLVCATLAVWTLSALTSVPDLLGAHHASFSFANQTVQHTCTRHMDPAWLRATLTAKFIVWYAVPLVILLFIYVRIGKVLLQSTKKTSVARSSVRKESNTKVRRLSRDEETVLNTLRNSADGSRGVKSLSARLRLSLALKRSDSGQGADAVESRKKVVRLAIVIVCAFAVLTLPHYMRLLWNAWRPRERRRCLHCFAAVAQPLTFLLLFLNSGVNPFLYAFLSERFRAAVSDTLTCRPVAAPPKRRPAATERRATTRQSTLDSDIETAF